MWTTHESILDAEMCEALIAEGESRGFEPASVTTAMGFAMMPELRNNDRVIFDDPELAAQLWPLLPQWSDPLEPLEVGWRPVGLNERFRLYRYTRGQKFDWHADGAFRRNRLERSRQTVLIYLNEGCEGGATEIRTGPRYQRREVVSVEPRCGRVLRFAHQLIHRGAPVREGIKYVLRTDVMYRRLS
ncbi:MAG: 2OG-Fe(II) oxygenase [Bradymonadia bacterium]